MREFEHRTVLRDATVQALQPQGGGRYLDGTLGGGGHAQALLEASGPDGVVVGIDRDPHALHAASLRLSDFGERFQPVRVIKSNTVPDPWDGNLRMSKEEPNASGRRLTAIRGDTRKGSSSGSVTEATGAIRGYMCPAEWLTILIPVKWLE